MTINALDRLALKAIAEILKRKFTNLTAEQTLDLASDILIAVHEAYNKDISD